MTQNHKHLEKHYRNELLEDVNIFQKRLLEDFENTQKRLKEIFVSHDLEDNPQYQMISNIAEEFKNNFSTLTDELFNIENNLKKVNKDNKKLDQVNQNLINEIYDLKQGVAKYSENNFEKEINPIKKINGELIQKFEQLKQSTQKAERKLPHFEQNLKKLEIQVNNQNEAITTLHKQREQANAELEMLELEFVKEKASLVNQLLDSRSHRQELLSKAAKKGEQILAEAQRKADEKLKQTEQEYKEDIKKSEAQLKKLKAAIKDYQADVTAHQNHFFELFADQE